MQHRADILEFGICWLTLIQADLLELVELSARHGFTTLSIGPQQYLDSLEAGETQASVRRRLNDAGVKIAFLDAVVTGLPGLPRAAPPTDISTCLHVACCLDAPLINVAHYKGGEVAADALIAGVAQFCETAAQDGVSIALEPIAGTGFPDLAATQAIIEASGQPNCGIMFDPTHWARANGTLADIQSLRPGIITGFQLCDRTKPAPGVAPVPMAGRDLPGEGELPLWQITEAVLANNPALTIELEVLSEELQAMTAAEAAARCVSAMQNWQTLRPG